MSLQSVEHHITYNAQHKVLICKTHRYGITDAVRHFHSKDHAKMTTKTRLQIRAATQHLELADPEEVDIPLSNSFPIDGLELVDNGAKCNECEYVAGTFNTMEDHCRNKHDWKAKDEPMWTKQAVQTFYPGTTHSKFALTLGKYRQFFAVILPTKTENQIITDQMIEG